MDYNHHQHLNYLHQGSSPQQSPVAVGAAPPPTNGAAAANNFHHCHQSGGGGVGVKSKLNPFHENNVEKAKLKAAHGSEANGTSCHNKEVVLLSTNAQQFHPNGHQNGSFRKETLENVMPMNGNAQRFLNGHHHVENGGKKETNHHYSNGNGGVGVLKPKEQQLVSQQVQLQDNNNITNGSARRVRNRSESPKPHGGEETFYYYSHGGRNAKDSSVDNISGGGEVGNQGYTPDHVNGKMAEDVSKLMD